MRGPLGVDSPGPFLLQRGIRVEVQEVGQRDVRQDLGGLPGAFGQQPGGDQPAHRFFHRVVVALLVRAGVAGAARCGQRVQHGPDHGRTLRSQVA